MYFHTVKIADESKCAYTKQKKTAKNYTWPSHTYTMFFPTSNISTLSHTINETFDCSEFSVRFNFVDGRSFAKCWFVCQIVHTHTQTRAQNNNETKKLECTLLFNLCCILIQSKFRTLLSCTLNSGISYFANDILSYSLSLCPFHAHTCTLRDSIWFRIIVSLPVPFRCFILHLSYSHIIEMELKNFFCCCCCRSVAVVIVVANDDFKYFFRALRPTLSHLYARTFTHRLIQMCVYNVRIVSAFHYGTHNFVEKWKQVASKSAQQQHSLDFIWIRFSDKLQTDLIGPNCFHLQKNPIETACSRWF